MIEIRRVDHIGIRVADLDRSVAFYGVLGFELLHKDPNDAVAILKNREGVEINIIYNANDDNGRHDKRSLPKFVVTQQAVMLFAVENDVFVDLVR